jgi:hypothetical protein
MMTRVNVKRQSLWSEMGRKRLFQEGREITMLKVFRNVGFSPKQKLSKMKSHSCRGSVERAL